MTYSFALIDRINLGAAYTAGMGADLVSWISGGGIYVTDPNAATGCRWTLQLDSLHFLHSIHRLVRLVV